MITIIDNDEMKITLSESYLQNKNTPDGKSIGDYILNKTIENFTLFKKIFKVEKLAKMEFILFDDLETWRNFYRKNYNYEPPEYSRGAVDENKNLAFSVQHSRAIYNTTFWHQTLCTNSHEAFHFYYKKYIYKNDRIVWFDEGLAQYFSGESNDIINNEEVLKEELKKFLTSYKPINNLNERIQGNNDISDDLIFFREKVFDGYRASILIIIYIVNYYGINYLYDLMYDNKKIREFGKNAINNMIKYYLEKFNININVQKQL